MKAGGYAHCWTGCTSSAQVGRTKACFNHFSPIFFNVLDFVKSVQSHVILSVHFVSHTLLPPGYSDLGVSETPLLYSLLVTRCREDYCEDFCVYKGSSPEHSAFLPPGFSSSHHLVTVTITVEDHQGAAITAFNK